MASNEDYERDPRAYRAGLNSRDAEVQHLRKEVEALTEAALDHRATASRALEERDRLGDALYAAYVATGADADGAQDWRQLFLPITSPSWTAVITDEINQLRVDADSDVARAEAERDRYAAAFEEALDTLAHIVSQANVNAVDGDDGFIARYDLPVGSIHKAIPFLARHGIVVDEFGAVRKSTSVDSGSALAERDRDVWKRALLAEADAIAGYTLDFGSGESMYRNVLRLIRRDAESPSLKALERAGIHAEQIRKEGQSNG